MKTNHRYFTHCGLSLKKVGDRHLLSIFTQKEYDFELFVWPPIET